MLWAKLLSLTCFLALLDLLVETSSGSVFGRFWSSCTITCNCLFVGIIAHQPLGCERSRVVRVPDLKSGGLGCKSRSDRQLELFLGSREFNSSAALVKKQLVCLLPVGIFNYVIFYLNYLFLKFNARPHKHLCCKHCRG